MRRDRALTAEERMDARAALKLLPRGGGLTLEQCVRMALQLGPAAGEAVTVGEAVERFLRAMWGAVSPLTWRFYEQHLLALAEDFEGVPLRSVDRRWLTDYFAAQSKGVPQRWRAVRRLLKWSVGAGLLPTFPAEGFAVREPRRGAVSVLTAEEVARIWPGAGIYTAALGLMVLAGVRPYEVRGGGKPPMCWGQIDLVGRTIRIEGPQAKTRVPRVLEAKLPGRLWAVLKLGRRRLAGGNFPAGAEDPVCPFAVRQAYDLAKRLVGGWSPDVLRHTFASAHVAAYGDLTATSLLLGHEGSLRMLHRHYRGRMTEAEGKAIFGIKKG
jgi:integrase